MDLHQLVKECKQGSKAAQQLLFDRYADGLLAVCCRYVRNREDAEEILLDGFFKFFRSIDNFQYVNEPATTGWLKKIMVNECLMYLRKQKPFQIAAETETMEIAQAPDIPESLSAHEILELILQLPTGYRTVFNLYEIEGLNHGQIAELLQISEGTSKSQLNKARQLLQKMMIQKDSAYARRISK